MHHLPPALVKTWLFFIRCKDPKLAHKQFHARQQIRKFFASIEMAELYLEQSEDTEIEVVVI